MTPWFIVLGAGLIAAGTLFMVFRHGITGFIGDYRQALYGRRDRGFLGLRPVDTPFASGIGFMVVGAVFLAVGILAAVEHLPWSTN